MTARRTSNGNDSDSRSRDSKLLAVLQEQHRGLRELIDQRFDEVEARMVRADEDRAVLKEGVEKIDGRFWKFVAGTATILVVEILHIILTRH